VARKASWKHRTLEALQTALVSGEPAEGRDGLPNGKTLMLNNPRSVLASRRRRRTGVMVPVYELAATTTSLP